MLLKCQVEVQNIDFKFEVQIVQFQKAEFCVCRATYSNLISAYCCSLDRQMNKMTFFLLFSLFQFKLSKIRTCSQFQNLVLKTISLLERVFILL